VTTIAFLGAGNIAQAIMGGMLNNGMDAKRIWACDPSPVCMDWVKEQGIHAATSNDEAVAAASVVILCVKPDVLIDVLANINVDVSGKLLVSVAAGITTTLMSDNLPDKVQIVRCMPNTPALVKAGMTALFATPSVSDEHRLIAEDILSAVGKVVWVSAEEDLNAVTAVSGSGPAYFFLMMESMIAAAVDLGLPEELSRQLVIQTALGSASIVAQGSDDPGTLRQNVTSPGGTTQAAIEHFQSHQFEKTVQGAVTAAQKRSVEMANEK